MSEIYSTYQDTQATTFNALPVWNQFADNVQMVLSLEWDPMFAFDQMPPENGKPGTERQLDNPTSLFLASLCKFYFSIYMYIFIFDYCFCFDEKYHFDLYN